jgi:hypothetical protein
MVNVVKLSEAAQNSEPKTNKNTASENILFVPYLSDNQPLRGTNIAKVRAYDMITDCVYRAGQRKSCAIAGRAVFSIIASKDCINIAIAAIHGNAFESLVFMGFPVL